MLQQCTSCTAIHRLPVNSPHKGQWRGALMLYLICAWTNGWVNNGDAGDLIRHCAHYNATVMNCNKRMNSTSGSLIRYIPAFAMIINHCVWQLHVCNRIMKRNWFKYFHFTATGQQLYIYHHLWNEDGFQSATTRLYGAIYVNINLEIELHD